MSDPFDVDHHHNNIAVPENYEGGLDLVLPDGTVRLLSLTALRSNYPTADIPAYRYTTDHGQHGPYRLTGVALRDLLAAELSPQTDWEQAEVISVDGYGNRVWASETADLTHGPILLCWLCDGRELTPQQGRIRLVVPSETDNALRQIKWVKTIRVY